MIFFFYLPTVACVVLGFLYLNSATTTVITKGIVVGVVGVGMALQLIGTGSGMSTFGTLILIGMTVYLGFYLYTHT